MFCTGTDTLLFRVFNFIGNIAVYLKFEHAYFLFNTMSYSARLGATFLLHIEIPQTNSPTVIIMNTSWFDLGLVSAGFILEIELCGIPFVFFSVGH
jgi:hypothetical protein